MQILAIDYGLRHIGLAVGQPITGTATALATLSARKGTPDWSALDKVVQEWQPQRMILGLPLNMDGTESTMTQRVRIFSGILRKRYQLPVEFEDERLTSRTALTDLGTTTDDPATHGYSARLIAESWLNKAASA